MLCVNKNEANKSKNGNLNTLQILKHTKHKAQPNTIKQISPQWSRHSVAHSER
jgi:hypothetical protein